MEQTLKRLCEKHRLTAISFTFADREQNPVGVFIHWNNTPDGCAHGYGDTFDIAFERALSSIGLIRTAETGEADAA